MKHIRKQNDSKERLAIEDIAKNDKYPDLEDLMPDDWDGFVHIQSIEKDFDAEKGFVDYDTVIMRRSDGKFFKFTYTQFGHNGSDMLEQTAVECVRKEKTVYYYE